MRRILFVAMLTAAALSAAPTVSAQGYPPAPPFTVSVSSNSTFAPGGLVDLNVQSNGIQAGGSYSGTLNSTPVALPATTATAAGAMVFAGVRLPADFELNATHSLTLVNATTGATIGTGTFFVRSDGRIGAAPTTGGLPRTGSDGAIDRTLVGVLLVAGGAAAVAISRRRRAGALAG